MSKMTKAEKRDLMSYIRSASKAQEAHSITMINITKKLVNDASKKKDFTLNDSKDLFEHVKANLERDFVASYPIRRRHHVKWFKDEGIPLPRTRKGEKKRVTK